MSIIVGVKFKQVGKVYYFSPCKEDLKIGDGVIVETARGLEFGKVATEVKEVDEESIVKPLKPVIRKATEEDVQRVIRNANKKAETMKTAEEKIKKHGLDMKLTDVEFTFDGQKVIFYFTAEGRIDFRDLVRDLASVFKVRIELRQIGIRDEAKCIGGIAPCGRVCCCSQFLGDFEKVSIKMAKTQGLSLNPTKISGLCGRLMCCLAYENDHYAETARLMPKMGAKVTVEEGKGIVVYNDLLKRIVSVKLEKTDGFEIKQYPLAEVKFSKNPQNEEKKQDKAPKAEEEPKV